MIEFLSAFIAVIVAFIAGMLCEWQNQQRKKKKIIEEQWIGEPPPYIPPSTPMPTGGIAPRTTIHLYAPWKK